MFNNLVKSVSSLVQSSSNSFGYTLGDELAEWKQCSANNHNSIWKLHEAKKSGSSDDDEKYTVFALTNRKTEMQNRVDAAMNAVSKLKSIRHPHILSYVDCLITDDKILLVTEYVYPLIACIEGVGNASKLNESFIALGLHQISSALSFVHNDLKDLHCLVSPSAIFINQAGDFKLGSFELAHKYRESPPSHFATCFDVLLPIKYRPKELTKTQDIINILLKNPIHSIDAWCVGCIIFELFNSIDCGQDFDNAKRTKFTKPHQLSDLSAIPFSLQRFYKRLLATSASSRITLNLLSDCEYIEQNSLVQTSKFIAEIAIKSDAEKRQFLQHLDQNIESYPPAVCKFKILPTLTHLLQHGFGSNPLILSCVLKISSSFIDDEKEKAVKITPVVINMFKNNERGTRINLLKSLPKFIDYLDTHTISNDIWPQLINGFTDSSPVLREQSVRSVIHFTPKLNDNIISSQLLPLLDKIQCNDAEPAIRTNICIVLGKIAKFVQIKNNQANEVLLAKCFSRSLNDSFIPCRNAALLSFAATISLFNENMIASKILPAIMRYTCDPHKTVRDSAFKCIEIGLQKLKQYALTLPATPVASNPSDDSKRSSNANGNQADNPLDADSSGSYLGNVTSWASRISGYSANSEDSKPQQAPSSASTAITSGSSPTPKQTLRSMNKSSDINTTDLGDLFADNNSKQKQTEKRKEKEKEKRKSNGMQLKKESDHTGTQDVGSLDDFLKSFTDELDKRGNDQQDDLQQKTAPKSKIKHKNKHKKPKKHKKSAKKTESSNENDNANDNVDDFFDDW
mmetsp:Transcript_51218/g.81600  ORF Transcript_51218/g.81600 Transcript_51218/m.81600 type:complete len:798 (+) Transcript_51218:440-2833(+)